MSFGLLASLCLIASFLCSFSSQTSLLRQTFYKFQWYGSWSRSYYSLFARLDPVFGKTSQNARFLKRKRAFWACFRENWVYKFGHSAPNWPSKASLPHFHFKADPDPAFTLMRIRIQLLKISIQIRIHNTGLHIRYLNTSTDLNFKSFSSWLPYVRRTEYNGIFKF